MRAPALVLPILLAACGVGCDDACQAEKYDARTNQPIVEAWRDATAVLNDLPTLRYRDLPDAYVTRTGQHRNPFARRLRRRTYLVVDGDARHRFIAGRTRLSALMAGSDPYLLVDRRLVRSLIELRHWLDAHGHDPDAFVVREGFRPPQVNEDAGGAPRSRHIYGEAVDLVRGDLDRDGDEDQADKAILLEAAEAVIGNRGGVGRYPGTETVHIDVRGRRARWDSY